MEKRELVLKYAKRAEAALADYLQVLAKHGGGNVDLRDLHNARVDCQNMIKKLEGEQ